MYSDQPCYFTIIPLPSTPLYLDKTVQSPADSLYDASFCYSPTQTPDDTSSRPNTPIQSLLPTRDSSMSGVLSPTTTLSFMQRQTSVAHKSSSSRPRPQPMQNVLHVTSDDSRSSGYSSSADSQSSSIDFARCSRCQRTASLNSESGNTGMVQYGLNLWYCVRCAAMVGLTR